MNREIKFRGIIDNHIVFRDVSISTMLLSDAIRNYDMSKLTFEQYTGYKMLEEKVFFGDLVSNNYKTDKEVIREVVMHKGCIMLKRVKGKSSLPKHIEIDAYHALNYKIIGNIHEGKSNEKSV